MPERSFRVVIANSTSFLTLKQSFNHLCGGDWTPGGWTPHGTILPGESGPMQSESDGFATGTEGYVKYDVDAEDGRHGMIYVYWDNPFMGNTHFRFMTSGEDVLPDCDYCPPSGSSTFPPDNSGLNFTLNMTLYAPGPDLGGNITSAGDLLIYGVSVIPYANVFAGLGYMLGVAGIDKNPELDLELVDASNVGSSGGSGTTSSDSFGSLGPPILQLLTQASPSQWVGRWANANVSVDITLSSSGFQLTAVVYDGSTTPPLSFSQTIVPGPTALLSHTVPWLNTLVHSQALEPGQRVQFAIAAQNVIKQSAHSPRGVVGVSKQFQLAVGNLPGGKKPPPETSAASRVVGGALANLVNDLGGVAYMSNHVVLRLYGVIQSGDQTGMQLLFQRLDASGNQITSSMLNLVPHLT